MVGVFVGVGGTGWAGVGSGSTEPGLISLPNSSLPGSSGFIAAGCVGLGGPRGSTPVGLLAR